MGLLFSQPETVQIHFLDGVSSVARSKCSPSLGQYMNVHETEVYLTCGTEEGLVCLHWSLGYTKIGPYSIEKIRRVRAANRFFQADGLDAELNRLELLMMRCKRDQSTQTYDNPDDVD